MFRKQQVVNWNESSAKNIKKKYNKHCMEKKIVILPNYKIKQV